MGKKNKNKPLTQEAYDALPDNIDVIRLWQIDATSEKLLTSNTINSNQDRIKRLIKYAEHKHSSRKILSLNADELRAYFKHMRDVEHAKKNTINVHFSSATRIFKWAAEKKLIRKNPMKHIDKMNFGNKSPRVFIPLAAELIDFREWWNNNILFHGNMKPNLPFILKYICIYELALSSGLRVSELNQVRSTDIKFKYEPPLLDKETGESSQYVGGCIDIDEGLFVGKNIGQFRRVYFSVLAGRLLKLYMDYNGILGKDIPLFPLNRVLIGNVVGEAWGLFQNERHGVAVVAGNNTKKAEQAKPRRVDLLDVNIDDPSISASLRNQIALRKQRALAKLRTQEQSGDSTVKIVTKEIIGEARRVIRLHTFRHFFGCFMYYRTWFGTRHDMLGVRDLMRHQNFYESASYINRGNLVASDKEWKELALGTPRTYWRVIPAFVRAINERNAKAEQQRQVRLKVEGGGVNKLSGNKEKNKDIF